MKKILLLSFSFVFAFTLSACATQTVQQEKTSEESTNQTQNKEIKQEEIKQQAVSTQINNIQADETVASPVTITGTTKALKNKLFVELRDIDHNSKVRGYAVVSENNDAINTFKITLNFVFNSTDKGFIAAYELDENGQEKNLVEIPVNFKVAE